MPWHAPAGATAWSPGWTRRRRGNPGSTPTWYARSKVSQAGGTPALPVCRDCGNERFSARPCASGQTGTAGVPPAFFFPHRPPSASTHCPATLPAANQPQLPDPRLYRPRLGQGTFRVLVTDSYQRRCAVTGEKALPVLDAAHIRPVAEGGQHRLDNGLLLRTDVHRLYDKGYVTVTPDGRFLVSRRLKTDFDNGEPYMPYNDKKIWMPGDPVSQPDREALEWHSEEMFLR